MSSCRLEQGSCQVPGHCLSMQVLRDFFSHQRPMWLMVISLCSLCLGSSSSITLAFVYAHSRLQSYLCWLVVFICHYEHWDKEWSRNRGCTKNFLSVSALLHYLQLTSRSFLCPWNSYYDLSSVWGFLFVFRKDISGEWRSTARFLNWALVWFLTFSFFMCFLIPWRLLSFVLFIN